MKAETTLQKIWKIYSPFFHLFGIIFLSGVAWAGVSSQSGRIDKLENKQGSLIDSISDIKVGQARIEQKVDDLHRWIGGKN